MKKRKYIQQIPNNAPLEVGDEIKVRKARGNAYRWEEYKVASDGKFYPSSMTEDEWNRMDQLTQQQLSKLLGLKNQSDITSDINNVQTNVTGLINGLAVRGGKIYSTLALANADIANILLNEQVQIADIASIYSKDSAGASSLTFKRFLAKDDVVAGNKEPVTSGAVASQTVLKKDVMVGANTYNYLDDIPTGQYISATTGLLVANATSAVSKIYPATAGKITYVDHRTGNSAIRYLNASGDPLPPLDINGDPFPAASPYQPPYLNGGYMAPAGSVGYQFTSMFTGTTNRQNIVVSDIPGGTGIPVFSKGLIPVTDYEAATRTLASSNKSDLDVLKGPSVASRVNKLENTSTPAAFPTVSEVINLFKVDVVVDNDSPTKDIFGYKRVFSNTLTPTGSSLYRTYSIGIGSSRPSRLSIGFWAKTAQLQSIFTNGRIQSYLGLRSYSFDLANALAGNIDVGVGSTGSIPEYNSLQVTLRLVESKNGYSRLEFSYFNIDWKTTFMGTSIVYYFLFNGAPTLPGVTLETSDWTFLINAQLAGGVLNGSTGEYPSNVQTLGGFQKEIDDLNTKVNALQPTNSAGALDIEIAGSMIYIASKYNATQRLVQAVNFKRTSSFTNNPNVNFVNEYLVNNVGDIKVSVLSIKSSGDDICPANIDIGYASYIGGNHSWNVGRLITKAGHGKTLADVGAEYKDSANNEFVIGRYIDVNSLWILPKNRGNGSGFSFPTPVGDLIYIRNGINTGTITGYTSAGLGNTYTTISPSVVIVKLDGTRAVSADGLYKANSLDIVETYYGLDMGSIVQALIDNRPAGGYTTQPLLNSFNTDRLLKHTLVYRYTSNGVNLINTGFNILNNKDINVNFHGFVQAGALATGKVYVPKSKPFTAGSTVYNFNVPQDWTNGPSVAIHLTPEYWEDPQSPPDRVLNLNTDTVFQTGYITDRGVGKNRKDKVVDAMFLNTSKKLYPMGYSIAGIMPKNSFLSCVAFRSFTDPKLNPIGRTSFTWFELDGEIWIYLDYHGVLLDEIVSEPDWINRKIEVYESKGDVRVLSDIVSTTLMINSNVAAGGYGFIVLKLK
ncbi:hypothetical protein [Sphingobacterium detergens]|uniref:hypothetical protein n=1 Tax=Sphingobacterium detergens TaxID=1145106 RepID=UPI003AAEF8A8